MQICKIKINRQNFVVSMKKTLSTLFLISLFLVFFCMESIEAVNISKTRLIVTTDLGGSDPDDIQSMIHLLVCSDRIDIEGLISSQAWVNDPDKTPVLRATVESFINVLPNLQVHSADFPSADYLRTIVARGQAVAHMEGVGPGKDSPGSELIVRSVTDNDERPIWLVAWGGMNTIAQALWKLQNILEEEDFNSCLKKIRIYDILGQDDAGAYIAKYYPEIVYIRNKEVYGWAPDDDWTRENIQSRLPLGNSYPNRIWATEGDSPSFLYVYANGLNVPERWEYGGWGGRFSAEKVKNIRGMDFIERSGKNEAIYDDYYMIGSAPEGNRSIKKWEKHIHNDFAARMIWAAVSDYAKGNHHPVVTVNSNSELLPIYISVSPGDTINLSAYGTYDPDNDNLKYLWSVYEEPSSYSGTLTIQDALKSDCQVRIPENVKDNLLEATIHVILEVTDSGTPPLTSYRRIILQTK